jgi:hypothetical protein
MARRGAAMLRGNTGSLTDRVPDRSQRRQRPKWSLPASVASAVVLEDNVIAGTVDARVVIQFAEAWEAQWSW